MNNIVVRIVVWLSVLASPLVSEAVRADLVAAVLPSSRSVQTGVTATAFATVINAGTETATGCGLGLASAVDAAFTSRITDPATNLPVEPSAERVDIPAGAVQTYVFGVTPNSSFAPIDLALEVDCDNTNPAASVVGLNTLQLSASDSPVPDIVTLAATLANDGIVRAPGTAGTGVFSVAVVNLGAGGEITAVPSIRGATANALVCETDPVAGVCISAIGPSVTTTIASGATPTFGVFLQADGRAQFDPAGVRVSFSLNDAAGQSRGATSVAYETQVALAADGGELFYDGVVVNATNNDAVAPIDIDVASRAAPPAALPGGVASAAATSKDISISNLERLDSALNLTFSYDAALDDERVVVLHYNEAAGEYEPTTLLAQDPVANTVTVDSRNFSSFVVTQFDETLPAQFSVTGFDPNANSWNIRNFGAYFSPGGNCLGMAGYSTWFFKNRSESLNTAFSSDGGAPTSIAHLTATRAHLAQSQYWAIKQFYSLDTLSDARMASVMKSALQLFDQPLILLLGVDGSPRHATVLYGYNETGFLHYEVNTSQGASRGAVVPFDGTNFGSYAGYNSFGFVALPSLGRNEDFADLTTQALAGFTGSSDISVTAPGQDEVVSSNDVELTGVLTGDLASGRDVIAYVNGQPTILGNGVSAFSATVPIKADENTIVLVAGDLAGQNRWSKNAATQVLTFTSENLVSVFRATLTWNKGDSDVDLYVTEPSGDTAWYASQLTENGMELDFDNTVGFGPENTRIESDDPELAGNYDVRVHYYDGDGPVSGQVQLLLDEGSAQQINRVVNWTINADGDFTSDDPGSTGVSWTDIALVDIENRVITPR